MIDRLMWITAAVSLVGTVANIYKARWCFSLWLISNLAWAAYDVHKAAYAQAALMAIYACLAVWGLIRWGEKGKQ